MRRVRWEPSILDALRPDDPADRWARTLRDQGYFLDFDDHPRWEPARRLRAAVAALAAAEDAVREADKPLGISVGEVHPGLILAPVLVVAALSRWAGLAWALGAGALGFGALAWVGLASLAAARVRRKERARAARAAVDDARGEAVAALRGLFGDPFVATVAFVEVECVGGPPPGGALGEGRSAADPS